MKRKAIHLWFNCCAIVLVLAGTAAAAEKTGTPAATAAQRASATEGCDSIAAARAQLAAVLKLLDERSFADIGALKTELEQIQQQALTRDEALAKAEQQLDDYAATEAELRQQIATLTAQRDELARSVKRLQAAAAETTQPTTPQGQGSAAETEEAPDSMLGIARQWAEAWSAQDVDAYLAFYDEAFRPPDGMTRQAWESQRRNRLSKPGQIHVEISNPEVESIDETTANLRFTQRYRSERYSDITQKRLLLKNRGGNWRIMEEHAKPAK